jgi:uncharacterized protein YacL
MKVGIRRCPHEAARARGAIIEISMSDYNETGPGTYNGIMDTVKKIFWLVVSIAVLGAVLWFLLRNSSSIAFFVVAIYKSHPIVFVLVLLAIVIFGTIYGDRRENKKIKAGDQLAIEHRISSLMDDHKYTRQQAEEAVRRLTRLRR